MRSPPTTACVLRPLAQPILTQQLYSHSDYKGRFDGVDLDHVMAFAREVLAEPRTTRQLREAMGEQFPQHDAAALAFACRNLLPFIQVPPRGSVGHARAGRRHHGRGVDRPSGRSEPSVDDVMMRYVAAFGPATVQDAATWSRYTGLREVFDRIRPRLRTFRDEDGREYFDVPDGPLPDEDTPAPVRFLPAVRQPPALARRPEPLHRRRRLLRDLAEHHRLPRQRPRRRDARRDVAVRPADQGRAAGQDARRADDHHAPAAPARRERRRGGGAPVHRVRVPGRSARRCCHRLRSSLSAKTKGEPP